nr:hypothetical protein [Candidatus Gracilibacteria bacterium]
MKNLLWFDHKNYTSLEIIKYKSISNKKIIKSIKINDKTIIDFIIDEIRKIPSNGDAMIKFGPNAEKIDLIFSGDEGIQTIYIYEKQFKTPSTGFNSNNNIEKVIYEYINKILYPNLINKVKKLFKNNIN